MQRRIIKPAIDVTYASFASEPPSFINPKQYRSEVQKLGLRYEKRVQDHLRKLVRGRGEFDLLCNPWIVYHTRRDGPTVVNFCQPDCFLVTGTKVIIVECKLQHTNESYEQMRLVYEPVLRCIYPANVAFALVEVCKWFDPQTPYKESYYHCENVLEAENNRLGIHIYKPRGRSGEVS